MKFNFKFSEVNYQRCIDKAAFNYNPGDTMVFNQWMAMCMTEELGEMVGAMKKLIRGFNPRELKKIKERWLKVQKYKQVHDPSFYTTLDMPSDAQFEMMWEEQQMVKVKKEAADLLSYFDLFLTRNNINIHAEVKDKFNLISEEMGCPQFKI